MSDHALAAPTTFPRPTRKRRRRVARAAAAFVTVVLALLWYMGVLGGNVRAVEPGRVYRSGQLTGGGLQAGSAQLFGAKLDNVLREYDIKTVINLRGASPDARWYKEEEAVCASRGVQHIDLSFSAVRLPPPAQLRKLLRAFDSAPYPLLFHCHGGSDRSGLAGVLYLHLYKNVPLDEALSQQLTWRYGHIAFGQAHAMSDFFALYKQTGNSLSLRDWIERDYPALYAARVPKEDRPDEQPDEPGRRAERNDTSLELAASYEPVQDRQSLKKAAKDAIGAFFNSGGGARTGGGVLLANLQDRRISESSGLAASRLNPGILWTHNDSGDGPYLFAIDRKGRTVARVEVKGAKNVDWEDIALGPGPGGKPALYISDIGDNGRARTDCTLYRVPEPKLNLSKTMQELAITGAEAFPFQYADGPHDAETLLVPPVAGTVCLVTKDGSGVQGVYEFPTVLTPGRKAVLRKAATLRFTESYLGGTRYGDKERMATGGAVSPDGRRVIVRTYLLGYEWNVAPGQSLDEAMNGKPHTLFLPLSRQGESITYRTDGKALLMTSEMLPTPLYEIPLP